MAIRWLPVQKPWNSPWKISHSLTNPFSGGSAAIPSVPTGFTAPAVREPHRVINLTIHCEGFPRHAHNRRGVLAGLPLALALAA